MIEPEPQLAKLSTGDRCTEESGAAICNRPADHEGDHYDWCDEIFWRRRRTDPEPEPGGATSAWEHHRHD